MDARSFLVRKGLFSQSNLDQIEFMFQYGDLHWTYPPLDMTIRKIKVMLDIREKIIDAQREQMEKIKNGRTE